MIGGNYGGYIGMAGKWSMWLGCHVSRLAWCLEGTTTCARFFGGQSRGGTYALMWQWSGGGGTNNGHGDFDQIDGNLTP